MQLDKIKAGKYRGYIIDKSKLEKVSKDLQKQARELDVGYAYFIRDVINEIISCLIPLK